MARVISLLTRREGGAELIEFALVLPVFLLVTAGIIDFGLLFQQYNVITNAAREGARVAVLPNTTTTEVREVVEAYVTGAGLKSATAVTQIEDASISTHTGGPSYKGVRVTVTYPCQFFVLGAVSQFYGPRTTEPSLHARAVMRYESQ